MNNYKKLFLLFLLLLLPIVNAYQPLTIEYKTLPDISSDRFYVSQNIIRPIYFSVHSDYLSSEIYKPLKIKYRLTIYPEQEITNGTNFKLSKSEETIVSEVSSEIGIEVIARDFTENLVKLKLNADLYDEYNNIIESSSKTLTLITNNSIDDYTYTPNRDEPSFKGVVYSRDVSYLINKNDVDYIKIKSYSDYNYVYDVKCNADNTGLITKTMYVGDNEFDLNISIDNASNLQKGVYQINCYAYNRDNLFDLKKITLNYLDEAIVIRSDINKSIDANQSIQSQKSTFKEKLLKFRENVRNWVFGVLKKIRSFFS